MSWQPIETAPTDCWVLLVYADAEVSKAIFNADRWLDWDGDTIRYTNPLATPSGATMRSVLSALACTALTACASTCPPPPEPPVWALATVPDEATFEQQVLYLLAENAQREAWGDTLYAHILGCRR